MKKMKMLLMVMLGAASLGAATTYTVTSAAEGAETVGTFQYALAQVNSKTSGEYIINFGAGVRGQTIKSSARATSIGTKVTIDGTGSGVTLVKPGTNNGFNFFDISAGTGSLIVKNLTVAGANRQFVTSGTAKGKVEIVGCRFEDCVLAGAALLSQSGEGAFMHVERTTFMGNATTNSTRHGSCLNVSRGRLVLNLCSFMLNSATGNGGAVYCSTTGNVVVANCSFTGNRAGGNGQALCLAAPRDAWVVESLFFGQDQEGEGSDIYTAPAVRALGYSSKVTLAHCGYERLGMGEVSGVTFNYTFKGDSMEDCLADDVCGTRSRVFTSCTVDGVLQTAPFPCSEFSGREGYYTLLSYPDWSYIGGYHRSATGTSQFAIYGSGSGGSMLGAKDIFGTVRPTSASNANPTTGAAQFTEGMPSLEVNILEDRDCPAGNEVSFREAVRFAAEHPELAANGKAVITFSQSVIDKAVDGKLTFVIAGDEIPVDGALTDNTLVVAPPAGVERLVFMRDGDSSGRFFVLGEGAKLEMSNADVTQFGMSLDEDANGGAMMLNGANTVVISNVCFSGNRVYDYEYNSIPTTCGGAIFVGEGSNLKVYGSRFDTNNGGCSGGAVYIDDSSSTYALFERVTFEKNYTYGTEDDEGGALFVGGGRVALVNTMFYNNIGQTAALQVGANADVSLINSAVSQSIARYPQSGYEYTDGTAINVVSSESAKLYVANSVIGGYGTPTARHVGYCQIRAGLDSKVKFTNSIISKNNDLYLQNNESMYNDAVVEYTEDELATYVLGMVASKEVHGVMQRYWMPLSGGALWGSGMEIRHTAECATIRAYYGTTIGNDGVMTTVHGASRVVGILRTLDTGILDNNWRSTVSVPTRQRLIGPVWASNSSNAEKIPDFRATRDPKVDDGVLITLSGAYANSYVKYLPPICGDRVVTGIVIGADVSRFDPNCTVSAYAVQRFIVSENNPNFKAVNGLLYSKDGKTLVAVPPAYDYCVIVEPGTETIGTNAFVALSRQTQSASFEVMVPDTVTAIGDGAFAGLHNLTLWMYGMAAPTAPDAIFGDGTNNRVKVPVGSKGWDGNPQSSQLPAEWHGAGVETWSRDEWPSLTVTTLADVTDDRDGLISLREAIDYARRYPTLCMDKGPSLAFDEALPVNPETGKMEIALTEGPLEVLGELEGLPRLELAVPNGRMLTLVGDENGDRRCFYVYWGAQLELRNVEIRGFSSSAEDNSPLLGGAIYLDTGAQLTASNCWFRSNGTAKSDDNSQNSEGGAIFVGRGCQVKLSDCSFQSNQAANGSAMWIDEYEYECQFPEGTFVLFERTSFSQNLAYAAADDGLGGAVVVSPSTRAVFNTCSLVANQGHVSDLYVCSGADVTMVNSAVSDSEAREDVNDTTGTAIEVYDDLDPDDSDSGVCSDDAPDGGGEYRTFFRAINCVFGGYGSNSDRNKNYRQFHASNGAWKQFFNSVLSENHRYYLPNRTDAICVYSETEFTNFVYDVSYGVTSAKFVEYKPTLFDAPKFVHSLKEGSVLYGTGVSVYHDADWKNIAFKYGDAEPEAFMGDAAKATIPLRRDILGHDWSSALDHPDRQRNIGPIWAWDRDGDFETVARGVPDYQMTELDDDSGVNRITPPAGTKHLPEICGGYEVTQVEVGPDFTVVDPAWQASSRWVRYYIAVDNPIFSSMGGCLYTNAPNGKVLVVAPAARTDILVQAGTVGIGDNAFRYCVQLESVKVPASLKFIGNGAFAGCNYDVYMHTMSAPTFAANAFEGCDWESRDHFLFVPMGSKGWDGKSGSSLLPARWPANGLYTDTFSPGDYPSLTVTTCEDVADGEDGKISLREAVAYLSDDYWQLGDNGLARIEFDPALADENGTILIRLDPDNGEMQLYAADETFLHSIAVAAPEGCRVRLNSSQAKWTIYSMFEVSDIYGTLTLSGLDLVNWYSGEDAAVYSDWEQTYVGEVVITNCTFQNCSSTTNNGGAVSLCANRVKVVDSVFTGNHANGGAGGGLAVRACGRGSGDNVQPGLATIERCSFYRNDAVEDGGLALFGSEDYDQSFVVNTSIIGNEVKRSGAGVGVHGLGTVNFVYASIIGNTSVREGNLNCYAAVERESAVSVNLINSVLAGSTYAGVAGAKYLDCDVALSGAEVMVRPYNSVFGEVRKNNSPAWVFDDSDNELVAAGAFGNWFHDVASVTNLLTGVTMHGCTPVAGGPATTKEQKPTDWLYAPDMLGFTRTDAYTAIGAVAVAPADRPALTGYAAWAASKGLTGADAAPAAKPALWGGEWANAFIYTYGEGLVDGSTVLLNIALDAAGEPVLTTAPVVEGHGDFIGVVIGAPTLTDWTQPVILNRVGNSNDWRLPAGKSAHFFKLRLEE